MSTHHEDDVIGFCGDMRHPWGCQDDYDDMTDKDRTDQRIHYERMQQRYLVWYEVGHGGGLFSTDVDHFIERARENRDGFIEEGYPARVLKLTVVDGEPVAQWVE